MNPVYQFLIQHVWTRNSFLRQLVIRFMNLIPENSVLLILNGRMRGMRWIKGSHSLSVLVGGYEKKQSKLFAEVAKNRKCFLDLGAHVGYYTLLFKKFNPEGEVWAFEPLPRNTGYLHQHIALNHCVKVSVIEAAVSDRNGLIYFNNRASHVGGRIADDGDLQVQMIGLQQWIRQMGIFPDIIKMDIEGQEAIVVSSLSDYLTRNKPLIFLSTHSKELEKDCLALLSSFGYTHIQLIVNKARISEFSEYLIY